VIIPAGASTMGTDDDPWAYDNERGAHTVHLDAFAIDATPVTNAAFAEFEDDGGYRQDRWWDPGYLPHREALRRPMYLEGSGTDRHLRRFGRLVAWADVADQPVQHVNWYEADAYARWAGKRLPTEAEWEKAARWDPATGRSRRYPWGDHAPTGAEANLGQRHDGPAAVGSYPAGASPTGCHQLIGDVWEWTSSTFRPHPGFASFPYREYSEVFWGDGYRVLKGGSWAADPCAVRASFRNWDLPIRRQIFSGFRCARSL
jgi:iron(II)-dependent oxidoreductase